MPFIKMQLVSAIFLCCWPVQNSSEWGPFPAIIYLHPHKKKSVSEYNFHYINQGVQSLPTLSKMFHTCSDLVPLPIFCSLWERARDYKSITHAGMKPRWCLKHSHVRWYLLLLLSGPDFTSPTLLPPKLKGKTTISLLVEWAETHLSY